MNKTECIEELSALIAKCRPDIAKLVYVNSPEGETVMVYYNNTSKVTPINVSADSCLAMIYDVSKTLLR